MIRSDEKAPAPRGLLVYGIIAIVALTVRLTVLAELRSSPFFDTPVVDAREYQATARRILDGSFRGPFWQAPLYPLALAGLMRVGDSVPILRLAHVLLGTLNCLLVTWLALVVWRDRGAALAAGLMASLHGTLVLFDTELLPAGLQVTAYLCLTASWLRWHGTGRRGWALAAGLALSLAVLGHGPALALYPAAGLALLARPRPERLTFALAALLPLLPFALFNSKAAGRPAFLATNGGLNLWVGNNPDAAVTETLRPGGRWQELFQSARRSGAYTQVEQDTHFYGQTRRFAWRRPGTFVLNLGRKLLQVVSGDEVPRNQSIYPRRGESRSLALLLWKRWFAWPFSPVAVLAVLALASPGLRSPATATVGAVAAIHLGAVALVFVTARYRLPAAALLTVLAGGGLAGLLRRGLAVLGPSPARPLAAAGLALILSMQGVSPERSAWTADDFYVLGDSHAIAGRKDEACRWMERALDLEPDHADAWFRLGVFRRDLGLQAQALQALGRAVELEPAHLSAWEHRGRLLLELGRRDEARESFLTAARVDTCSSVPLHNLGLMALQDGAWAAAADWLGRAVTRRDTTAETFVGLAAAFNALGRHDDEEAAVGRGLRNFPTDPQLKRIDEGLRRRREGG